MVDKLVGGEFGECVENLLLCDYTTYRLGGAARYAVFPDTVEHLKGLIEYLGSAPYAVIGNGSNLLVADGGYDGVAILTKRLDRISVNDFTVTAECGASLANLLEVCRERELGGLEFLSGLPGSVGGALCMNAGCFERQICDYVIGVNACDKNGNVRQYSAESLFYRDSVFLREGLCVLDTSFRLFSRKADESECLHRFFSVERSRRQPRGRSAGSVFKNIPSAAGRIIDECGLKGLTSGGAEVSPQHANFIIAHDGATAADVYALIAKVVTAVKAKRGITLEPEIKFLGDFNATLR